MRLRMLYFVIEGEILVSVCILLLLINRVWLIVLCTLMPGLVVPAYSVDRQQTTANQLTAVQTHFWIPQDYDAEHVSCLQNLPFS